MENDKRRIKSFKAGRREKIFVLQWHVTARCENHCKHCYLMDSPGYKSEIENELSLEQDFRIVDDFYEMLKSLNVKGRINFTGGDPLLKKGIFSLIKYARKKGIGVAILGNPEPLNIETARKLKSLNLRSYQVSIDGLRKTHDYLRYEGNFDRTIEGIRILNKIGVPSVVMFTLSKFNMNDLIPVIEIVAKEKVKIFDFARLVPIGSGIQFKNDLIDPYEYRELLLRVLRKYEELEEQGCETFFGRKDNLWKFLYYEMGKFSPSKEDKETIFSGCAIGINLMVIAADGIVYPCRRLPVKIGKVPEQKLKDIFIESKELNRMRRVENLKKCKNFPLLQYCRGCPAVAYGLTGDYFAPDPQCWR